MTARRQFESMTPEELTSDMPLLDIIAACDDDGDGKVDPRVWSTIEIGAGARLRMACGGEPSPALQGVAEHALRLFVLASIWRRRYPTADANPFEVRAQAAETRLERLATGLDRPDGTLSGVATVSPTRATPRGGRLMT